jgi:hypothetical protein
MSVEHEDVFWLYELTKGEGIFQGCSGTDAEKILRQVVASEPEAGEPFQVVTILKTSPAQLSRVLNNKIWSEL